MRTNNDAAQFVTSKNAGSFLLTLDMMFADEIETRGSCVPSELVDV
jgi:hypothetical protein